MQMQFKTFVSPCTDATTSVVKEDAMPKKSLIEMQMTHRCSLSHMMANITTLVHDMAQFLDTVNLFFFLDESKSTLTLSHV